MNVADIRMVDFKNLKTYRGIYMMTRPLYVNEYFKGTNVVQIQPYER